MLPREFLDFLAAHHGVFTREEAAQCGVNRHALATLKKNGIVIRTYPRTFRMASSTRSWESRLRGAAVSAVGVVSHRAAATMWKIDGFPPGLLEVTIPESRSVSLPGVCIHRSRQFGLIESTKIEGIEVTGIARTVLDLAAVVSARKLHLAIDSVLRQKLLIWPDLYLVLAKHSRRGRNGCGRLRKVLDVRYGESVIPDSAWNRNVGDLLVDAGLPKPTLEHEIRDPSGGFLARVDLAYPQHKIAIELDSVRWHFNQESFTADPRRKNRLMLQGWTVLTFTWSDYVDTPNELIRTVRLARSSKVAAA